MADTLHDLLRALHMATGFVGLAAWIPALTRKGDAFTSPPAGSSARAPTSWR